MPGSAAGSQLLRTALKGGKGGGTQAIASTPSSSLAGKKTPLLHNKAGGGGGGVGIGGTPLHAGTGVGAGISSPAGSRPATPAGADALSKYAFACLLVVCMRTEWGRKREGMRGDT